MEHLVPVALGLIKKKILVNKESIDKTARNQFPLYLQ
jgi:hypothetical protein